MPHLLSIIFILISLLCEMAVLVAEVLICVPISDTPLQWISTFLTIHFS